MRSCYTDLLDDFRDLAQLVSDLGDDECDDTNGVISMKVLNIMR